MHVSLPTSRYSILGTAQLRSLSHRSSTHEPTRPGLHRDSQLSFRTHSPSSSRTPSRQGTGGEQDDDAQPLTPRQRPRQGSTGSARRVGPARSRRRHPNSPQPDSDTRWHSESTDGSHAAAAIQSSKWIEVDHRTPSADYEKEAHQPHELATEEPRKMEETMEEVNRDGKPFQGLADYPLDLGKSRKLIDDDYLKTAFGITMSRRPSEDAPSREKLSGDTESIPPLPSSEEIASPMSELSDMFEMEVPLRLDEGVHSELEETSVPHRAIRTSIVRPKNSADSDDPASTDSSASTLKQARLAQHLRENSATAVAVISPDQVLESPKPRRPFSTVSIEGMTQTQMKRTPLEAPVKSANSMSSAETTGLDGKSSEHSPRSSMSSVVSAKVSNKGADSLPRPVPRPRRDPDEVAARYDITSMYHETLVPSRESHSAASTRQSSESQNIRRQASDNSIRSSSNASNANINKPLPPEPGRSRRLSHISEQSSTPSRASSITIRQSHYTTRSKTSDEMLSPGSSQPDSRMSMLSGFSLRSKYTPKDLDSLDDAFQRREPPRKANQGHMNSYQPSRSTSEMSLVPDSKYGLSRESSRRTQRPGSRDGPTSKDTVPPLPSNQASVRSHHERSGSGSGRKNTLVGLMVEQSTNGPKVKARSQSTSTNHISAQTREPPEQPPQRSATMVVGGSSNKAHRVLGKPVRGSQSTVEEPYERNWPRHDSPEQLDLTPSSSRSGAESPVYEHSQDAHFEEIRRRMELLSPKDDPNSTFVSEYERNLQSGNMVGPEVPSRRVHKPTLSTHMEYPETGQIAELEASVVEREREVRRQSEQRPVELEGCNPAMVAELPMPSPNPPSAFAPAKFVPPTPPPPPASEPFPAFERRGRNNTLDVPSYSSGGGSTSTSRSTKARSIASMVASEIPDIYASLPSNASNSQRPSMNCEADDHMISADAAERVLYRILQSLDSLPDLFAAARVSRGFYRTFKHHERPLLRRMLWRTSPAAWELREVTSFRSRPLGVGNDTRRNPYLAEYTQDVWAMANLKTLILKHCTSFLRQETIRDLSGKSRSSSRIDEAFWRVWTFCKIFGCGSDGEDDIIGQMDWLKGGRLAKQSAATKTMVLTDEMMKHSVLYDPPPGFADGNGGGLNADELYDMTEVWTCLGVLVRGYHERRDLARKHGVFDGLDIPPGSLKRESAALEEWTCFLLAQGPNVILQVVSPSAPTEETFSRISSQGHTEWTLPPEGSSRSTFLKEALSRVYDEQMQKTRPLMAGSPRGFSDLPQVVSPTHSGAASPSPAESRQRIMAHQAELRAKKEDPSYRDVPVTSERPMSNFQEVLSRLESIDTVKGSFAPPVPKMQKITSRMARKPKVTEPLEEKARLVEEMAKMAEDRGPSPNIMTSPSSALPIAPRTGKGTRLADFRSKVAGKRYHNAWQNASKQSLGSDKIKASQTSLHSYVSKNSVDAASVSTHSTMASHESSEQREEIYAPMIEKLVSFGFGENRSRRALENHTDGNFIDFELALADLAKQREHKHKMERLARMG